LQGPGQCSNRSYTQVPSPPTHTHPATHTQLLPKHTPHRTPTSPPLPIPVRLLLLVPTRLVVPCIGGISRLVPPLLGRPLVVPPCCCLRSRLPCSCIAACCCCCCCCCWGSSPIGLLCWRVTASPVAAPVPCCLLLLVAVIACRRLLAIARRGLVAIAWRHAQQRQRQTQQ
jgi:hypothetical protein